MDEHPAGLYLPLGRRSIHDQQSLDRRHAHAIHPRIHGGRLRANVMPLVTSAIVLLMANETR